ncbi:MAG: hypothetical protein MSG64_20010 [Pyrinomonadaceae bacterium MAG19_C2-C3]|nr:hypothetical protein [Pyrinomonadaceae bacterium MAG19_C2-C3]
MKVWRQLFIELLEDDNEWSSVVNQIVDGGRTQTSVRVRPPHATVRLHATTVR